MDVLTSTFQTLFEQLLLFLPRLIVALVVFFLGLYLAGLIGRAGGRALDRRAVDLELKLLLVRLTRWTVAGIGTIVALQQVDFNLTGFLAGLGIIGFTIGFAVQDVSKNFIAGVLLLLQQPFDIGDAISVGGYAGTVTDIRLRDTELRTFDGLQVVIPNGDVYVSAITNYSRATRRRLELNLGVAYDSDLEQVTRTLRRAMESIPGVITDDPAPVVVFKSFGESSIDLTVYYWIELEQTGYFDALDQGVKSVKAAFEEAGIEIPFPVRTVLLPGRDA